MRAQREREVISRKTQRSSKAAGKGAVLILAVSLIAIKAFSSLPSTVKTSADQALGISKGSTTTTTTFAKSISSVPPSSGAGTAGGSVSPDQVVLPQITPVTSGSKSSGNSKSTTSSNSSVAASANNGSSSAPSSVTVRVFNGTDVTGAAGKLTSQLAKLGYNVVAATNATTQNITATVIYYSPGFQSQASKLASVVGIGSSGVKQMSFSAPLPSIQPSDLNVVLGTDKAS